MLPVDFGKGWMSKEARDLFRIAVAFGGFDPQRLLARFPAKLRTVQTRHVLQALQAEKGE